MLEIITTTAKKPKVRSICKERVCGLHVRIWFRSKIVNCIVAKKKRGGGGSAIENSAKSKTGA